MGNLIRAEFYRLRRRPHSVLALAAMFGGITFDCGVIPVVSK